MRTFTILMRLAPCVAFIHKLTMSASSFAQQGSKDKYLITPHSKDVSLLRAAVEPLPLIEDPSFGSYFDRFGTAKVVAIGEGSHGTSEFYRARCAITKQLIEKHGFRIVGIEGDWPDVGQIDIYCRHRPPIVGEELSFEAFERFPTWMWKNQEVHDFMDWLRDFNLNREPADRVEFRGLDLYSMDTSQRIVLDYLDKVDPKAAAVTRQRYACLTPWQEEPQQYGLAAMLGGSSCETEVMEALVDLLKKRLDYIKQSDGELFFDAAQNARLVRDAERYYRAMYHGKAESWNLRDRHMFNTLQLSLEHRGEHSKAIVWAHNSHIGDATATEMGWSGEFNIGELCRRKYGKQAVLIGQGTDRGTVAAASDWGAPMEVKTVLPSRPDSYERLCAETAVPRFLLDLRHNHGHPGAISMLGAQTRLERAIGVIYKPETERQSHYFEADLPAQFDAWLWFEETQAVTPLPAGRPHGVPETYPFGL